MSHHVPSGKVVSDASASARQSVQAGQTVDSIRITGIKLMISEIKLKRKDGGGVEDKVKTGPALLSIRTTRLGNNTTG
jgi:hypothetical protein